MRIYKFKVHIGQTVQFRYFIATSKMPAVDMALAWVKRENRKVCNGCHTIRNSLDCADNISVSLCDLSGQERIINDGPIKSIRIRRGHLKI